MVGLLDGRTLDSKKKTPSYEGVFVIVNS